MKKITIKQRKIKDCTNCRHVKPSECRSFLYCGNENKDVKGICVDFKDYCVLYAKGWETVLVYEKKESTDGR
jgi:hypothetical protein